MSEPTLLDTLLGVIDAATDDFHRPATLWFADADPTKDPDGFTLGTKEVDGHPLPHLLGFVAPPEWTAFGLTMCGWAADLDDGMRPSKHPNRRRVRHTLLIGRSGLRAGIVRFEDGGEPLTEPPPAGMLLDAVLRVLQLETDPPDDTTTELFTAWWLNDVVGTGRAAGQPLTWRDVVIHHPAVRLLSVEGPVGRVPADHLVRLGRMMATALDWSRLREKAAAGEMPSVDPELAAWMDDGMFSRWLLGDQAPVDDLLDACIPHVSDSCFDRMCDVVEDLRFAA